LKSWHTLTSFISAVGSGRKTAFSALWYGRALFWFGWGFLFVLHSFREPECCFCLRLKCEHMPSNPRLRRQS